MQELLHEIKHYISCLQHDNKSDYIDEYIKAMQDLIASLKSEVMFFRGEVKEKNTFIELQNNNNNSNIIIIVMIIITIKTLLTEITLTITIIMIIIFFIKLVTVPLISLTIIILEKLIMIIIMIIIIIVIIIMIIMTRKIPNCKCPGLDGVQGYWLKICLD